MAISPAGHHATLQFQTVKRGGLRPTARSKPSGPPWPTRSRRRCRRRRRWRPGPAPRSPRLQELTQQRRRPAEAEASKRPVDAGRAGTAPRRSPSTRPRRSAARCCSPSAPPTPPSPRPKRQAQDRPSRRRRRAATQIIEARQGRVAAGRRGRAGQRRGRGAGAARPTRLPRVRRRPPRAAPRRRSASGSPRSWPSSRASTDRVPNGLAPMRRPQLVGHSDDRPPRPADERRAGRRPRPTSTVDADRPTPTRRRRRRARRSTRLDGAPATVGRPRTTTPPTRPASHAMQPAGTIRLARLGRQRR